ncbi:hypothetical protein A8C56_19845 [Niabella ginsenosidivorans]|uniref:Uncharacterized protein n=1 Tax=Niabella ginsenosidivorans TaxID=1176587 RepID=A0A1A9I8B4_9BACT|nr:hypothetical protein A8C56_19845 [Niabella ginsenosidivorans]
MVDTLKREKFKRALKLNKYCLTCFLAFKAYHNSSSALLHRVQANYDVKYFLQLKSCGLL